MIFADDPNPNSPYNRTPCPFCRWPQTGDGTPTGRNLKRIDPRRRQILDELTERSDVYGDQYLETLIPTLPKCRPCRGEGYIGESWIVDMARKEVAKARAAWNAAKEEMQRARDAEEKALERCFQLEDELSDGRQLRAQRDEALELLRVFEQMMADVDRGITDLSTVMEWIRCRRVYGAEVALSTVR